MGIRSLLDERTDCHVGRCPPRNDSDLDPVALVAVSVSTFTPKEPAPHVSVEKGLSGDHQRVQPALRLLSRHPPPPGLSVPGGLFCFSPKAAAPHGVSLSPSHGGAAPPPPAAKAVRHRRRAGLSGESHHQRHPAPPAGQFAVPEPGGAEGQHLPPLLRGERGTGAAAALSGQLHRLCPAGRPGGQAVRPATVESGR